MWARRGKAAPGTYECPREVAMKDWALSTKAVLLWVNALGEYVLSNDVSFDPNIGSNLHWQRMPKQR